jgi:hypothetical protein
MELITADLSVDTIRRVIINACIHVSGRERVNKGLIIMKCSAKRNNNHRSHNTSYYFIEVVDKTGLTDYINFTLK